MSTNTPVPTPDRATDFARFLNHVEDEVKQQGQGVRIDERIFRANDNGQSMKVSILIATERVLIAEGSVAPGTKLTAEYVANILKNKFGMPVFQVTASEPNEDGTPKILYYVGGDSLYGTMRAAGDLIAANKGTVTFSTVREARTPYVRKPAAATTSPTANTDDVPY